MIASEREREREQRVIRGRFSNSHRHPNTDDEWKQQQQGKERMRATRRLLSSPQLSRLRLKLKKKPTQFGLPVRRDKCVCVCFEVNESSSGFS